MEVELYMRIYLYHARKFQLGEISYLVLSDKLIIEIIY